MNTIPFVFFEKNETRESERVIWCDSVRIYLKFLHFLGAIKANGWGMMKQLQYDYKIRVWG